MTAQELNRIGTEMNALLPLRVSNDEERMGLDLSQHGESL
ncbi:ammonium transporter [Flaviaesturariibacter aridisoli]|uniref:Ammonium transporter n=1 Tax=Flaviaesturariibacter aridisoli TaxID=2545761 RepID=A0A4R4DPF6_9BACT|nr:ammonium transporter [Flaviaesturariibacter aridisoli]TCZ63786.1 ammonium transporter [Flaviaesturariibacter aridisoli]